MILFQSWEHNGIAATYPSEFAEIDCPERKQPWGNKAKQAVSVYMLAEAGLEPVCYCWHRILNQSQCQVLLVKLIITNSLVLVGRY
jgi:hypothetical protein